MLEAVMLLKSFRVCREVSGNLMIYGPRKVHLAQPFRFRTRRLENAPPRAATANLVPRFLPTRGLILDSRFCGRRAEPTHRVPGLVIGSASPRQPRSLQIGRA